ncbi:hypothetical protein [Sorangium sp. So ce1000]|uniref:hypothetical protein n=1 Tax=Sorangium sp. So ce1000 TaxID=3133325 RepID=UPI003F5DFE81
MLAYVEGDRAKLGINISRPIGDTIVAYADWAEGVEKHLATRAVEYGKGDRHAAGGPPDAPAERCVVEFPQRRGRRLLLDNRGEGHAQPRVPLPSGSLHPAGLAELVETRSDPAPILISGALWCPRGYAIGQQEPTSVHKLFVRAVW